MASFSCCFSSHWDTWRYEQLLSHLHILVTCTLCPPLQVTCYILSVFRFGTSGFPYFVFRGPATVWPEGASLSNITIAAPYNARGYSETPLVLSATQDAEVSNIFSNLRTCFQFLTPAWCPLDHIKGFEAK